ncbi:subtilisin-like protease [Mycena maculata]|uniref:Subtilisin-like protease n=1 Tax=Mycena maculata TaxID=230809 RepID=A0AAD7JV96_9AGAR|nr:subtilisin-like protease [Mycena maculata]
MKLTLLSLGLLSSAFAVAPISTAQQATQASPYVPNAYIIELSGSGAVARRSLSPVYDVMRKQAIEFSIDQEYDAPDILIGAAIRLSDVAKLSEIPGVQAIRPIKRPVSLLVVKDPKASGLPDTYSTHVMTGVDKVHAQGNFGAGIKIGIIDTGIDYTHPLLGQGFGPGFKVIGGWDFVGNNYNGEDTPQPNYDPLDQCNGHGTHVAGIIGASPNNTFGISGVASDASLAAYRIFGCTGFTTDDIITAALIMAYNQKMDILTLSLGGASGWTEGTSSVVASRIAAQGRVVTVAAGNNGAEGAWYTSDPGGGLGVISVASVDNIASPVQNATVEGTYFMPFPLNVTGAMPIYATSTNTSQVDDACNPLPDSTPDLSGYIVVVHRGTCLFTQKLANIAAKGGKVMLIYNSDTGGFSAIAVGGYKAVLISAEDGKFVIDRLRTWQLVQQFIDKSKITVSFPQSGGAFSIPNPSGGLISSFSTIGPTFDMQLSPALAAPGGNILSTFPLALGGYAIESGTSMATPFAAGAAALILKALGTGPAVGAAVPRILQTTAASVASTHTDGEPLQTVAQQGAGLVQVDRAVNMKTIVSPGQLALNDTANFKANHTISITNTGNKTVTYQLLHVPALTVGTVSVSTSLRAWTNAHNVPSVIPAAATIAFSGSNVTVHPGTTKEVVATITPPPGVNTTFPLYSGFIHVVAPNETLKVTYLGVAASLIAAPVLDSTSNYFGIPLPTLIDASGRPQEGPENYTFTSSDFPFFLFRLAFGTPKLRFDLVSKDIALTPTIPSKRSAFTWWWTQNAAATFGQIKTIGPLVEFDYQPRSTDDPLSGYGTAGFSGTFANGTRIDDGQYRVLLRALKIGGNPNKEGDYESWLSPQFGVIAPP